MKESGIGRENGIEAFEACESIPGQRTESRLIYGVSLATQTRRANRPS